MILQRTIRDSDINDVYMYYYTLLLIPCLLYEICILALYKK